MEWSQKEANILKLVESFSPSDTTKRFFFALFKYSAFAVIMFLVFDVIFGRALEVTYFAYALMIVALMVYELKGREILMFQIMRKLQARVRELEKK